MISLAKINYETFHNFKYIDQSTPVTLRSIQKAGLTSNPIIIVLSGSDLSGSSQQQSFHNRNQEKNHKNVFLSFVPLYDFHDHNTTKCFGGKGKFTILITFFYLLFRLTFIFNISEI